MTQDEIIEMAVQAGMAEEIAVFNISIIEAFAKLVAAKAIAELESQEPVAKVVLTETLELPCLQWLDLNRQFDFKGGEYLYTHPPQRKENK